MEGLSYSIHLCPAGEDQSLCFAPSSNMDRKEYVEFIHTLPCVVCWMTTGKRRFGVEGHHLESVRDGMSDWLEVPLCSDHHRGPNGIHFLSRRGFELRFKLTELDLIAGTIALSRRDR